MSRNGIEARLQQRAEAAGLDLKANRLALRRLEDEVIEIALLADPAVDAARDRDAGRLVRRVVRLLFHDLRQFADDERRWIGLAAVDIELAPLLDAEFLRAPSDAMRGLRQLGRSRPVRPRSLGRDCRPSG